jgi:hypothetical protein
MRARTSLKSYALCSHEIDLTDLCPLWSYCKYLTIRHRQRRTRKGGSAEIHPCELMASWIYDEKFWTGMQFLFRTSSFTTAHDDDLNKKSDTRWRSWAPDSTIRRVVHDDDLEHPVHEQEAQLTTMIDFEFPRSLKNSATTFQAAVRQPATTDPINGPTWPPIGISSTTIQSSALALTEIRTMKPEE